MSQNDWARASHDRGEPSPGSASNTRNLPADCSPRKRTDWENLLGAVDMELRRQRAGQDASAFAIAPTAVREPLHPSTGADNNSPAAYVRAEEVDYAFKIPKYGHHRRGGEGGSGGGPAYSGSTADAACFLATLPQRIIDDEEASDGSDTDGDSPAPIVPAAASPSPPARVQASGRRGPRGQSRFKGVCITRAGKWRAVIYIGRKQKYLGVFDSEFDAAQAYDAAAVQHFAQGAKLNFPRGCELESGEKPGGLPSAGGSGGAAAPRSVTPPPVESGGRKRSRKRAFDVDDDDSEWLRDEGPWNSSRR